MNMVDWTTCNYADLSGATNAGSDSGDVYAQLAQIRKDGS